MLTGRMQSQNCDGFDAERDEESENLSRLLIGSRIPREAHLTLLDHC